MDQKQGQPTNGSLQNELEVAPTNSIQITWQGIGVDQVKVVETNESGCIRDTIFTIVSKTPSSGLLERYVVNPIVVYPNPSNGYFTIESSTSNIKEIEIVDILGKVVSSRIVLQK